MSSILSRQKIRKLKSLLADVEAYDKGIGNPECLKPGTMTLIKNAIKTSQAYHRLADIADKYIKEVEVKVESGFKVDPDLQSFVNDFGEELAKA